MSEPHTIFKYQIVKPSDRIIAMPDGAVILSAQNQNDIITIWAMVNPENPKRPRVFDVVGTGGVVPDGIRQFIGTVQISGYVWHVFELLKQ